MRKEFIIPILVGTIGGIIVFMGIKTANDAKNQIAEPQVINTPSPTITQTESDQTITKPNPNSQFQLTITQPSIYQLITNDRMILKGATNPNDQVIIISDIDSHYLIADAKGNFDQEIKLNPGYNSITVFSTDSRSQTQKTDLIYISSPPKN